MDVDNTEVVLLGRITQNKKKQIIEHYEQYGHWIQQSETG